MKGAMRTTVGDEVGRCHCATGRSPRTRERSRKKRGGLQEGINSNPECGHGARLHTRKIGYFLVHPHQWDLLFRNGRSAQFLKRKNE